MTTLAQAVKVIVQNSIDQEYLDECGTLAQVYQAEYGNYNGTSPKACAAYLQGLPSVCTIPFYNGEILELLAKAGVKVPKDDDKAYALVEKYWQEAGYQFYMLVK
jgi:hypothetical protein